MASIITANGNIITDDIRDMYDFGKAYAEIFADLEDEEFFALFRDENGEMNYEELAQGVFDGPAGIPGGFINDREQHGHYRADGFVWFVEQFEPEWQLVLKKAYSAA